MNENYKEINVAAQEQDPDSVLNFYRKAIQLRKSLPCVRSGKYTEYDKASAKVYTYAREDEQQKILVVCSFTDHATAWNAPAGFDLTTAELLLCNYETAASERLQPYEARVYCWKK